MGDRIYHYLIHLCLFVHPPIHPSIWLSVYPAIQVPIHSLAQLVLQLPGADPKCVVLVCPNKQKCFPPTNKGENNVLHFPPLKKTAASGQPLPPLLRQCILSTKHPCTSNMCISFFLDPTRRANIRCQHIRLNNQMTESNTAEHRSVHYINDRVWR